MLGKRLLVKYLRSVHQSTAKNLHDSSPLTLVTSALEYLYGGQITLADSELSLSLASWKSYSLCSVLAEIITQRLLLLADKNETLAYFSGPSCSKPD